MNTESYTSHHTLDPAKSIFISSTCSGVPKGPVLLVLSHIIA